MVDGPVAEQAGPGFGGLLRQLRDEAGLTQEELAEAASLSPRSISDLERGINLTARKETARLLAGALGLAGPSARPVRGGGRAGARRRARLLAAGSGPPAARRRRPPGRCRVTSPASPAGPASSEQLTGARWPMRPRGGGVVGIHAIGGMAGIGKTTLAVHAAHRLAGQFPDGQIFLPLHAHTPGQRPVDPADALASLLLTAGVAPGRSRRGWMRGRDAGGITWRARRCCWCSMTRPGMSRSGRCCRAPPGAWC